MGDRIPKDFGTSIIELISGKKVMLKIGDLKVRGRVKECAYSDDGFITVTLEGYPSVQLDMNSYIKILK